MSPHEDVIVVGAGAAGLMAAIAARGGVADDGGAREVARGAPRVLLVDGQSRPGAKILISGGGRCNVTNETATVADYTCDRPASLRCILREFPPRSVIRFFASRRVPLVREALGKIYPASGRARDVRDALHQACERAGVRRAFGMRVVDLRPHATGWHVVLEGGRTVCAGHLIVATGGLSVPRTGSDGFGFELARRLGVRVRAPVPGLVALRLKEPPAALAGVTVPVRVDLRLSEEGDGRAGRRPERRMSRGAGSLLFTHEGISGPAALDVSAAWERCRLEGVAAELEVDFWGLGGSVGAWRDAVLEAGETLPGACLPPAICPPGPTREQFWADLEGRTAAPVGRGARAGAGTLGAGLARRLPRRLVRWLLERAEVDRYRRLAQADRLTRERVYRAVVHARLQVAGGLGYRKAEITDGGVLLGELERRGLVWRGHSGLHFCGEVVDVTGRLGGFNFQWAFSSGFVAGQGVARVLAGGG